MCHRSGSYQDPYLESSVNLFFRIGSRLRLIKAPFDVHSQSIAEILVRHRKVEPFRIKVATAPSNGFIILRVFRVGDNIKELLISRHAADILGRSGPHASDAAPVLG